MKNYKKEITELEELIEKTRLERFQLMKANDLKIQEVFDRNFNYFKEFDIQASGESAVFRMKNEKGELKDIFSVYFYSRYKDETRLELSYYTTNTHSEFELDRLYHLGNTARFIKNNSESLLKEIDTIKKSDLERENELYKIQNDYEREKRSYRDAEVAALKVQIELDLRSEEGIVFDIPKHIELKRTYSPKIDKIRITEVKGKTCTVAIEMGGGSYKTTESRVSIESLINQISSYNIL
jgi:hypothetical protein